MTEVVLDASAVIALVNNEPGAEVVDALGELQQRPFLELSNLWGQTLVYGTFVSAIFAVAEGESP